MRELKREPLRVNLSRLYLCPLVPSHNCTALIQIIFLIRTISSTVWSPLSEAHEAQGTEVLTIQRKQPSSLDGIWEGFLLGFGLLSQFRMIRRVKCQSSS